MYGSVYWVEDGKVVDWFIVFVGGDIIDDVGVVVVVVLGMEEIFFVCDVLY